MVKIEFLVTSYVLVACKIFSLKRINHNSLWFAKNMMNEYQPNNPMFFYFCLKNTSHDDMPPYTQACKLLSINDSFSKFLRNCYLSITQIYWTHMVLSYTKVCVLPKLSHFHVPWEKWPFYLYQHTYECIIVYTKKS